MYTKISKLLFLCLFLVKFVKCAVPVFTNPSANYGTNITINENTPSGTSIMTASATDADNDIRDYGENGAKFVFDGTILKTSGTFDYENSGDRVHLMQLYVRDWGNNYAYMWMYVTILDVNDNPPTFSPAVYTATVAENTGSGQALATLACSDPDVSVNTACSLSLVAGDDATAKFTLSGSTIQTSSNVLNYETHSHRYVLQIEATETPSGSYTGTAYVIITVTAVNEHAPVISGFSPSTISLNEDVSIGTTVCTVSASDSDNEPEGTLQFSITSGNTDNIFAIHSGTTSATIYLVKSLDYETTTSYSLVVTATDAASSPKSDTHTIPITVNNVNDNTPSCSPSYQVFSLTETASTGITVASLSCSDGDAGTTLSYSFASGNTDSTFSVSSAGVVTNAKAVDYDAGTTSFTLLIQVSDGTLTTTATVAVSVVAINDNSPSFSSNPTQSVAEDETLGTTVISYAATDNDASPHGIVNYEITSVTNSGTNVFVINKSSGDIMLAQALDYETTQSYLITVVATDGGGTTATGTVTISVTDVNDNTPSCTTNSHVLSVLESVSTSTAVISDLSCSDDDSGSNANLGYTMTTNPNNKFTVSQSGGIYSLKPAGTLDFETTSFYQLVITIADGGTPALSTTVSVQVNVIDVNEASPVFTSSGQYSNTVSESTSIGSTLVTVSASDTDSADDIIYAFQTTYTGFNIDGSAGTVLLTQSLDYETNTAHTLVITATDGSNTATATFSLTVTDVNEAPVFSTLTYSQTINENISTGTAVVTVSATDNDSGTSGTITYSIASGDGTSSFSIDSSTGAITTAAELDYETQNIFYLVIQAADGASPSLSATCLVTVTVVDLNDNAPVFTTATYTMSISEDTALSTTIKTIVASDADSSTNNNNVFEFSLTSVHPFSIGTTTGAITTNTLLNRETTSSYDVVIVATDKGSPAQTTTFTMTVSLIDVNDNTPLITGTYDTTISEAAAVNTIIFTVTATDADYGDNAALTYNVSSGDDNGDFKVDSNMIQIAKTLDRETTELYNLIITVTDSGATPRSASVSATVTISDANDFTPTFLLNETTYNISEDVAVGTTILTFNVTDSDSGDNGALNFSIAGYWTTGSVPFSLDSSTGILTTSVTFDRETLDTYGLWCRVSDAGSPLLSSDVNITIYLDDVNDNSPVFSSTTYTGSVTEGVTAGTSVMTLAATDADLAENAVVFYSIDTTASGGADPELYFNLDNSTGVLTLLVVPDRENISSYVFSVNAIDNGTTALTSTATVTVTVSDINDNAPEFSPSFYNSEIPYLVTCSSSITTLTATDADTGNNAVLTYSLVLSESITFASYFALDASSGQITLTSTVTTNSKYLMTFSVSDGGTPQMTTSTSATVRIDTYTPDDVVIVFYMSIGQSSYLSQESTFLSQLTTVYQSTYSTCLVRRWCVEEVSASSIKVNIYVISDNATESISNTGTTKTFITASTIRDIVASSDGTPSSTITGTSWDVFSITQVKIYNGVDDSTSTSTLWVETTEGIIVLSVIGVVLIISTIIIVYKIAQACKDPDSDEADKIEDEEEDAETEVKTQIMDLDDELFELPDLTSAKSIRPIRTFKQPDDLESFGRYRKPVTAAAKVDFNNPSKEPIPEKKKPIYPVVSHSPLPYKVDFSHLKFPKPEKVQATSQETRVNEVQTSKKVVNRKFDGRAIDPITGKVFEYNTKTNERRWVASESMAAVDELDF